MIGLYFRAAILCAVAYGLPAAAQPAAPPATAYFAQPAIEDPALSPDGRRVAARALIDGRARLALYDMSDTAPSVHPIALPEAERLEWHRWLDRNRLLVSLVREGPEPVTRLVSVDVLTGQLVQLGAARRAEAGEEILHISSDGGFLLLAAPVPGHETPGVYRVNLTTGVTTLAVAPQDHVWDWVADSAGVIRAGMAQDGKRSWMLYRKHEGDRFSRSARGAGDARSGIERFVPIRGTDRGYALAQTPAGRVGLYAYDFAQERLGALLYEDARVDLDGFQTDPDGRLLGVEYSADRPETRWFDVRMGERQARIDAALPGRANRVLASTADGRRALLSSESAGDPGAFYVFGDGRATRVAAINPVLVDQPAPVMRAVRYRARDGLEISGYLTLPQGRAAHGLPLIVMPHGGPFARDSWGYDPWVRYLADRGYAVLQPNYRGSTGFGRAFVARGDGQWGRGMQDDLDDGIAWLAGQGVADPNRVCIMGASYGGYAAMLAATTRPGPYRCAVSFAGISDVGAQLAYDHKTFEERAYKAWKARIQGNAPSLDALSPIARAANLRIPLLIAHGTDDDTVPPDQSIRLHETLNRFGRAHDYVAYPGQGHTLEGPRDNADFLDRVGRFLAEHNPA